eukprot:jgi/Botrbrau1/14405/Bobra.0014s0052.1
MTNMTTVSVYQAWGFLDTCIQSSSFPTHPRLRQPWAKTEMVGWGDPTWPWDDSPSLVTEISSIDFYVDDTVFGPDINNPIIRGIQTNYSNGLVASHGRLIGDRATVRLRPKETITGAVVAYGAAIHTVIIATSFGRIFGPIGDQETCDCDDFYLIGPVFGFFGGDNEYGNGVSLSSLGFWTLASKVPPSPLPPASAIASLISPAQHHHRVSQAVSP